MWTECDETNVGKQYTDESSPTDTRPDELERTYSLECDQRLYIHQKVQTEVIQTIQKGRLRPVWLSVWHFNTIQYTEIVELEENKKKYGKDIWMSLLFRVLHMNLRRGFIIRDISLCCISPKHWYIVYFSYLDNLLVLSYMFWNLSVHPANGLQTINVGFIRPISNKWRYQNRE